MARNRGFDFLDAWLQRSPPSLIAESIVPVVGSIRTTTTDEEEATQRNIADLIRKGTNLIHSYRAGNYYYYRHRMSSLRYSVHCNGFQCLPGFLSIAWELTHILQSGSQSAMIPEYANFNLCLWPTCCPLLRLSGLTQFPILLLLHRLLAMSIFLSLPVHRNRHW